ncbi:MAG: hypothetical protein WCG04_05455 [Alphaproteobacteria bacterium]
MINMFSVLISCTAIILIFSPSQEGAHKHFGTIELNAIVAAHAKALAKSYPNGQIPQTKMRHLAEGLKDKVQEWGNKRGLTLFAKGAVWSGQLPDYTDDILTEMEPNHE